MGAPVSRQVRRAAERRASKPAPADQPLTSIRWLGRRTKGQPFSRMKLEKVIPTPPGTPSIFVLSHPTKRRPVKHLHATPALMSVFFPSLPEKLAAFHLGQ